MTGGDTKALNKMMEAGQLDPNELLPKMAAYMEKMSETSGAYSKALGTSIVAQGRMNFQFEKFVGIFSKNGGEQGFAKIFNSLSEFMRDNHDVAIGLGEAWNKLGDIFKRTLEGVDNLLDGFSMLSKSLNMSETDLLGISSIALLLATRFGRIAAAAAILFLILEDISVGMRGGDSYTKDFLDFLDDNKWAKAAIVATAFATALGAVAGAIRLIGGAMGGLGAGGVGKMSGGLIGATIQAIKQYPVAAAGIAAIGGLNAYHKARLDEHGEKIGRSSDEARVANNQYTSDMMTRKGITPEQVLANMQRMADSRQLQSNLSSTVGIQKLEINISSTGNPVDIANAVAERIQSLTQMSIKNMPLTE